MVARELAHEALALIAEQPTRGLDVGATEHVHGQLVAERDSGRAVLLVSAELSEILALSDRVLVMFEGHILADLPQERADEQSVGLLMAGRGNGSRMSAFIRALHLGRDRQRIPRVALAVGFAALAGAALILVSGHDPLSAYAEIARGSLSPAALPDTLNWATPLLGMTLAVAVPLRGGMVNLGGDGQIVIGGLIGALAPLFYRAPARSAPLPD